MQGPGAQPRCGVAEVGLTPIKENKKIVQISVKFRKKNTKSIISQKLKIAQKKSFMQKMSARSIPIYSENLTTFEESGIIGAPFGRPNFTPIIFFFKGGEGWRSADP